MPDWNLGSMRQHIQDSISPLPTSISGALPNIIDQKRYFITNWVGITIGSVITETYQPAVADLTFADVLKLMSVQDMGVQSITIGDIQTNNQNLMEMAKQYEERGIMHLKSLSKGLKVFKARG